MKTATIILRFYIINLLVFNVLATADAAPINTNNCPDCSLFKKTLTYFKTKMAKDFNKMGLQTNLNLTPFDNKNNELIVAAGNGISTTGSIGVTNQNNAIGVPDGNFAEVYQQTDLLVIELDDLLNVGTNYTLTWRRKSTYPNTATADMVIEESVNGITWTTNTTIGTQEKNNFINSTLTTNVSTRFLRLRTATGTDDDFDFDAVSYDTGTTNPPNPGGCNNIDFSVDANGNPLASGTIVAEQYAPWGIHITSNNQGSRPTRIFDSGNITGGDTDLGTPNQNFGGPGIGDGGEAGEIGENNTAMGNALIIATGTTGPANDFAGGGEMIFTFDTPMNMSYLEVVDIDYGEIDNRVRLYDSGNNLLLEKRIIGYGNNSYQVIILETANVSRMEIELEGSGSIQTVNFCDPPPPASTVGDFVWNDTDGDGNQDLLEFGIDDVVLELRDANGNLLATDVTENGGQYEFPDILPGPYIITVQNSTVPLFAGNTSDLDGDNDSHSGVFTLGPNENKDDVDFGYNLNCNTPQVNNDNVQSCPTDSYTGDVSTNDANNATAIYEIVDNPSNGTVTMNQNGAFTYTPNTAFATGNDSFTYKAYNGIEACAQQGSVFLNFACSLPECTIPAVTFSGNTEVCAGNSTTITANPNNGNYTYQWSNGLGTGATKIITPPSDPTQNITTTYSVTVTVAQGCTVVETVDIVAESLPSATVAATDEVCDQNNGTITFTFPNHPNRTGIEFSIDGGNTYPYASPDNAGTFTISNLSAGNYDLWMRWGNDECPVNLPDVTIGNISGPNVDITGPTDICEGQPAQITAQANSGTSPYIYTWDNGLGNGATKTIYPTTTTTYTVTATDNNGCTVTDQIEITVLPPTDAACSDCPNPADDDGDGICESEDCDDDDPNIPAPPGTVCDDGNANTTNDVIQDDECTCVGEFVPCAINFAVTIDQPVYNNNGTDNNLSDDTFTFSVLITANGGGSTWTGNGQSGAYGTVATFGPFPVDAAGVSFEIVDTDNPNCREDISVNIASCIYSGVCTCCE